MTWAAFAKLGLGPLRRGDNLLVPFEQHQTGVRKSETLKFVDVLGPEHVLVSFWLSGGFQKRGLTPITPSDPHVYSYWDPLQKVNLFLG